MFQLNNLKTLVKKKKRIGRGGSRGGTSGKGHKGQKARSGPHIGAQFEGGQMPLTRRLPKRGFTNARFKTVYTIINLASLEKSFDDGSTVTKESLIEKGLVSSAKSKGGLLVKIGGDGQLTKKLDIQADAFTKTAKKIITEHGGQALLTGE
jgi:large subunit ribosomal protein L15